MHWDPAEVTIIHLHTVAPDADATVERRTTDLGTVVRIPIPLDPATSRVDVAKAQAHALETQAPPEYYAAEVVHAHVGMPTAWAVTQHPPAGARIVTIEHASYLTTLMNQDATRAMYAQMLDGSALHLAAGEREARMLRSYLPQHSHKIFGVGNPVDDTAFFPRETPSTQLQHWLYAGNLIQAKGIKRAVELYIAWRDRHPDREGSFTLVGQGPEQEVVEDLARKSAWADEIRCVGSRTSQELGDMMRQADVLVHLSHKETFGLTVVEAAMCGTPVVTTACGGPEDTLAIAVATGRARILEVTPEDDDLDALDDLAGELADSDDSAAVNLRERYGAHAFGERLQRASAGGDFFQSAGREPRVTVVSTSSKGNRLAQQMSALILDSHAQPVVVMQPKAALDALDPRALCVDLTGLGTAPGAGAYLTVGYVVPVLAVGMPVRWIAARAGKAPGAVGKVARGVRRKAGLSVGNAKAKRRALKSQPSGIAGPFRLVSAPVGHAVAAVAPESLTDGARWMACDGPAERLLAALEKQHGFQAERILPSARAVVDVTVGS